MMLVLIQIAFTSQGNSNEYQQHMFFYKENLVEAIQMSTNNICFYKENQKKKNTHT